MEAQPRDIQRYVTPDGRIPFDELLYSVFQSDEYRQETRLRRRSRVSEVPQ